MINDAALLFSHNASGLYYIYKLWYMQMYGKSRKFNHLLLVAIPSSLALHLTSCSIPDEARITEDMNIKFVLFHKCAPPSGIDQV